MRNEDEGMECPTLGRCPICDTLIPPSNLVIKYEMSGEWPRMFAECPACEDPVHPV